jgi:hypothetical protein
MQVVKFLWGTAAVMGSCVLGIAAAAAAPPEPALSQPTVYATGLEGPRGLRFGPDGNLYVAEAGLGGTESTKGLCKQVPAPVGPYTGGLTARISKIASDGTRTTVAAGFPSTISAGGTIGVADVAFLNGKLYALIGGGGCSHGNPKHPTGIAEVNESTGKWSMIADVGDWLKAHPAAYESADDFEPDGTLYNMIVMNGAFYAVEPNHGQVLSVQPSGQINQVIDISASEGHIVPTAIAELHGTFYIGNLNLFPIDPQWARILTVAKNYPVDWNDVAPGFAPDYRTYHIVDSKAGFTTVVAVDFNPADGLLYVLELSDAPGYPTPGAGKVVRILHTGEIQDVVTGLAVPTGMTFGPDGSLYISNLGAAPDTSGQILKVAIWPAS